MSEIYQTVKRTVIRDYRVERQRESTLGHILNGWIPASPEILSRVQAGVQSSDEISAADLLGNLKLDLGMFGRIVPLIGPVDGADDEYCSPLERIKQLAPGELARVIPRSVRTISRHRLENGSAALKAALASSLTSTAAAEAFAAAAVQRGALITTEEAFIASFLRQLGLNLLAWNYPSNLSRIFRAAGDNSAEQNREIERLFGFTPQSLAAAFGRRWRVKPSIIAAVENKPRVSAAGGPDPLREVCELSDAFGRRQHTRIFPQAERNWDEKRERLAGLVGSNTVKEVAEQIDSIIEQNLKVVFKADSRRYNQIFSGLRSSANKPVYIQNPFLSRLPAEASRELEMVHQSLCNNDGAASALSSLTATALPHIGFVRGLVCLDDQNQQGLRLALRFGIRPEDRGHIRSLAAAAIEARESSIPLLSEVHHPAGSVTRISSTLRGPAGGGVLVLELSSDAASDPERDNLDYFKAIRKCLECCLESQTAAVTV